MQANKTLKSVYVHIPFCKRICSYCDFCKNFYDKKLVNLYLDSLRKEIYENYRGELINTIYIGGGTPSCLSIDELKKLFDILDVIKKSNQLEYTFECNYQDINEDMLKTLKKSGVNRLSIGVQTFNKKYEKLLNREINGDLIIKNIALAKVYFDNINIDLMYGFFDQSLEDLRKDIKKFLKLDVNHISIYSLIVEEHTKLYIDNISELSDELQSNMYNYINKELKKSGYTHYEISNYAKNGYESKHNLTYWNNENYYGFGLGASGFIGSVRYTNTRSMKNYLNGNIILSHENLSKSQLIEDEIMLNLRKTNGINKISFKRKYLTDFKKKYDIDELIKDGYLVEEKENIYIPFRYLFVSNEIIISVLKHVKF